MSRQSSGAEQTVDDIDRRLIEVLRDDGRVPVTELARRANVSRANAYLRLERLRSEKVIEGFTVRVDPSKLGLSTMALILIDVQQTSWRSVRERLLELPGLDYLGSVAGAFDFFLLVRAANVETLRDVVLNELQGMSGIRATRTAFILDEHDQRA